MLAPTVKESRSLQTNPVVNGKTFNEIRQKKISLIYFVKDNFLQCKLVTPALTVHPIYANGLFRPNLHSIQTPIRSNYGTVYQKAF
jgi:hypothetical protein